MTRKDLAVNGYKHHHSSLHTGYVSRKSILDFIPAKPYAGKFGVGYIVDIPNRYSTQYMIREYWIKE